MSTRALILRACGVVVALAAVSWPQCTPQNPAGCHLGAATVEINIGPMPIDKYFEAGSASLWPSCQAQCGANCSTIQHCIENMFSTNAGSPRYNLKNYTAQGVKSVRFFVGLGGGGYSTPLDPDGNLNDAWLTNYSAFMADLRSYGVERVTPTPVIVGLWSAASEAYYTDTTGTVTSCGKTERMRYLKWLPFGLWLDNYFPECQGYSDGYNLATSNPPGQPTYFWGWKPLLNLIDEMLCRARVAGLTVRDFDIENEVNLQQFTVVGRLIRDNTHAADGSPGTTDVFRAISKKMGKRGFDNRRATFSTTADMPTANVAPPGSPTASLTETTDGNVDDGEHRYVVTFFAREGGQGETVAGEPSNAVTNDADHKQNELSSIPFGEEGVVLGRKIYRTRSGGSDYYLLTTIWDNSTWYYTDNTADNELGAPPPSAVTTDVYCDSWYGEPAMIINQSALASAYEGGMIGMTGATYHLGLACGGSGAGMLQFPYYLGPNGRPTVNNIHAYVCTWFQPEQPGQPARCLRQSEERSEASEIARALHNGVYNFLGKRSFLPNLLMYGEVNTNVDPPPEGFDRERAYNNVNGFNGLRGTSSLLYDNHAANTVFRVWYNARDGQYTVPYPVSPPYSKP